MKRKKEEEEELSIKPFLLRNAVKNRSSKLESQGSLASPGFGAREGGTRATGLLSQNTQS